MHKLLVLTLMLLFGNEVNAQQQPYRGEVKLCFGNNCADTITPAEILENLKITFSPDNHIYLLDSFEVSIIPKRGDIIGPYRSNGMNFTQIQKDMLGRATRTHKIFFTVFARYSTTNRNTEIAFIKRIIDPKKP